MSTKRYHTARSRAKLTKTEKMLIVLGDGRWHTTKELVRRVGHTFAFTKFRLVSYGYPIERERDFTRRRSYRYRLRETPSD